MDSPKTEKAADTQSAAFSDLKCVKPPPATLSGMFLIVFYIIQFLVG
jgi:hypothetical protein